MVTRAACPKATHLVNHVQPPGVAPCWSGGRSAAATSCAVTRGPALPPPERPSSSSLSENPPSPQAWLQVAPLHSKGSGGSGSVSVGPLGPCRCGALMDAATSVTHCYVSRSGPQVQGQSRRRPHTPWGWGCAKGPLFVLVSSPDAVSPPGRPLTQLFPQRRPCARVGQEGPRARRDAPPGAGGAGADQAERRARTTRNPPSPLLGPSHLPAPHA